MQGTKDNEIRYQYVNINNYTQEKTRFYTLSNKSGMAIKQNARLASISNTKDDQELKT